MNISAEIKELEKRLSENKPIYRIWAYMESGDDIEIFSSPSAEETQEEMISIINDSCISDVESYGISLGAEGNFDFYTFVPPKKPFDVEEELLNMENFPNKGKYPIHIKLGHLLNTKTSERLPRSSVRRFVVERFKKLTGLSFKCRHLLYLMLILFYDLLMN